MGKFWILVLILMFFQAETDAAKVRHKPHTLVMKATAFARVQGPTASGTEAREGIVAADPKVLPLGTRIRVSGSDGYDGNYLVTDTGSRVNGRHIDIYLPSHREAKRFGTRKVRVRILEIGEGKADAREKDEEAYLTRRR